MEDEKVSAEVRDGKEGGRDDETNGFGPGGEGEGSDQGRKTAQLGKLGARDTSSDKDADGVRVVGLSKIPYLSSKEGRRGRS